MSVRENFDRICAGGVVIKASPGEPARVLVIKVKRESGKIEWLLPKGHVEDGEPLETAAVREIVEETGIPMECLSLHSELGGFEYSFRELFPDGKWKTVRKNVSFFVYEYLTDNTPEFSTPKAEGIIAAGFFPVPEAESLLSYDAYRRVMLSAVDTFTQGRRELGR